MFCAGDIFAIGAMKCVKDRGITIPEDISFISIDDILLSRYIEPALTTIGVDKVKMGTLAVELLLKKMDGQNPESILVPMDEIVVRPVSYTHLGFLEVPFNIFCTGMIMDGHAGPFRRCRFWEISIIQPYICLLYTSFCKKYGRQPSKFYIPNTAFQITIQ